MRRGLSKMTVPQPDDDEAMLARRRRLAERELLLKEQRIEAEIREQWWSPPRILAVAGFMLACAGAGVVLGWMLR